MFHPRQFLAWILESENRPFAHVGRQNLKPSFTWIFKDRTPLFPSTISNRIARHKDLDILRTLYQETFHLVPEIQFAHSENLSIQTH